MDQGVDILLIASAWPYPRLEPWRLFNQVRALENQCYLISANSAGINRGKQFVGHSSVVDPWGVVIAGSGDEEMIVSTEIDIAKVKKAQAAFPAVSDRIEIV